MTVLFTRWREPREHGVGHRNTKKRGERNQNGDWGVLFEMQHFFKFVIIKFNSSQQRVDSITFPNTCDALVFLTHKNRKANLLSSPIRFDRSCVFERSAVVIHSSPLINKTKRVSYHAIYPSLGFHHPPTPPPPPETRKSRNGNGAQ